MCVKKLRPYLEKESDTEDLAEYSRIRFGKKVRLSPRDGQCDEHHFFIGKRESALQSQEHTKS